MRRKAAFVIVVVLVLNLEIIPVKGAAGIARPGNGKKLGPRFPHLRITHYASRITDEDENEGDAEDDSPAAPAHNPPYRRCRCEYSSSAA